MDQDQYAEQHDYLTRMQEVPTKLMTLNKELDLLDHHVSTIEFKLQMLDDMVLKAQALERRLDRLQHFLADDLVPIPCSPRDDLTKSLASDVTFEADRAEVDARLRKYGKTI